MTRGAKCAVSYCREPAPIYRLCWRHRSGGPQALAAPLIHPEPPRDSGEADTVNGSTALRTHQDNTRASGARK